MCKDFCTIKKLHLAFGRIVQLPLKWATRRIPLIVLVAECKFTYSLERQDGVLRLI